MYGPFGPQGLLLGPLHGMFTNSSQLVSVAISALWLQLGGGEVQRDWEAFKTKHLDILVGVLIVRKLDG